MPIVTLFQAKDHCHSDDNDDDAIQRALNAAEAVARRLANRNYYPDQDTLDDALAGVSASVTAANATYSAAMDAALGLDSLDRAWSEDVARKNLRDAMSSASAILNGKVASEDIVAAILLLTAHFYVNREEAVAVANGGVVQIPLGAERILEMDRALGPM